MNIRLNSIVYDQDLNIINVWW